MLMHKKHNFDIIVFALAFMSCSIGYAGKSNPKAFGFAHTVKGEVLLTRGILEFDTKKNDIFYFEDILSTGEDGMMIISFADSYLSIGSNTKFRLRRDLKDNGIEWFNLEIIKGQIRTFVKGLNSRQGFRVYSKLGVVEVQGTDFVTSIGHHSKKDILKVSVLKGKVKLNPTLKEGHMVGDTQYISKSNSGLLENDAYFSESLKHNEMKRFLRILPIPGFQQENQSGAVNEPIATTETYRQPSHRVEDIKNKITKRDLRKIQFHEKILAPKIKVKPDLFGESLIDIKVVPSMTIYHDTIDSSYQTVGSEMNKKWQRALKKDSKELRSVPLLKLMDLEDIEKANAMSFRTYGK